MAHHESEAGETNPADATDQAAVLARLAGPLETLLSGPARGEELLAAVCRLLHDRVATYDWVGFYRVEPGGDWLALGPFVGEPTEHVRIPFGRGICGQAAASGRTFLVPNVAAEDNYLSCSARVRSEIVVPVFRVGRVVGELDIDSHTPSAFDAIHERFLCGLCGRLGDCFA